MRKTLVILCLFMVFGAAAQEQGTVYVGRVGMVGSAINFRYYMGDQYLGKFKSNRFLKLSLDPGTYLIWAQSENASFAEVTVEAGKSYILQAVPKMGGMKARVELRAIYESDEWGMDKNLAKMQKLIAKKDPESFDPAEIKEEAAGFQDDIEKYLAKYEDELKGTEDVIQLTQSVELK